MILIKIKENLKSFDMTWRDEESKQRYMKWQTKQGRASTHKLSGQQLFLW